MPMEWLIEISIHINPIPQDTVVVSCGIGFMCDVLCVIP